MYHKTESRALQWERKTIAAEGKRPCAVLAWQVYRRLAETQPSLQADEQFFHATMRTFYQTGHQGAGLRRAPDRRRVLRRLKHKAKENRLLSPETFSQNRQLSMVLRDAVDAGIRIPVMMATQARPSPNGVFRAREADGVARVRRNRSALQTWASIGDEPKQRLLRPPKGRSWALGYRKSRRVSKISRQEEPEVETGDEIA